MICGTTNIGIDVPKFPGIYAAEVFYGWKLLEWKDGSWWHMGTVGRWTASIPVQWVGPLPVQRKQPSKMEFDL